ncbi:MAG: 3-deoxy-manno-octulosonate cytidylyltransferase [Planctomycetes bacterium]|nr:3-deoxy-manno-octulosonate cytidylyltransferase [Planctomycetota bacterium]
MDRSAWRRIAVIPARLASTRLPRKVLLDATGKYLIQHVYESIAQARSIDGACIATDSQEVAEAASRFGAPVFLTRADHPSGTDRMAEVVAAHPAVAIAVNVQGDEPQVRPADVDLLVELLEQSDADVATLAAPCPPDRIHDTAAVKVVTDLRGRALYFSRSPIPYPRYPAALQEAGRTQLVHVGMYGYRRAALERFAQLRPSPLERTESLEQLRLLENGMSIAVGTIERAPEGVDTPADYERFVAQWRRAHPGPGSPSSL